MGQKWGAVPQMNNLDAAQTLVAEMRKSDRLSADSQALVQIFLSLAESVDSYPDNAALWREYRQAEKALREAAPDDSGDAFDAYMRAEVFDKADV